METFRSGTRTVNIGLEKVYSLIEAVRTMDTTTLLLLSQNEAKPFEPERRSEDRLEENETSSRRSRKHTRQEENRTNSRDGVVVVRIWLRHRGMATTTTTTNAPTKMSKQTTT